ncbi:unnamed protein product [marine sediment metagenome]|uniref:DNA methylase N-4/N-6 domain-containing protein n=1 Tax=marine sediment metagenome TaxID=412755 RepID=X1AK92_9ZZZZ
MRIYLVANMIPFPNKKYQIIYVDPPWPPDIHINSSVGGKKITDHYPLMAMEDIKNLPVELIADNNSLLFLWVRHGSLNDAIETIQCWGFEYITVAFEWLKLHKLSEIPTEFMGGWFVGGAIELCLLGKRGNPKRIAANIHRLIMSKRREHSRKPNETRKES